MVSSLALETWTHLESSMEDRMTPSQLVHFIMALEKDVEAWSIHFKCPERPCCLSLKKNQHGLQQTTLSTSYSWSSTTSSSSLASFTCLFKKVQIKMYLAIHDGKNIPTLSSRDATSFSSSWLKEFIALWQAHLDSLLKTTVTSSSRLSLSLWFYLLALSIPESLVTYILKKVENVFPFLMDCFTVSTDEVVQVLMLESMALLTWYPTFKLWLQTKQAFLTYLNHQTTLLPTSSVMCVSKVFAILISLKLNQPVHPSTWVSFILPSTTQSEVGPTTNPTTSTSWMIGYLDSFLEALSFIGLQPSGLMYLAQQPNLFWTTFIQLLNQPTLPLFHPPYFPSFASSLLTLTYHLSCDEPSSSLQTHPNNNNTTVTHDTHSTWRTQLVDQLLDLQWYTCLSKVAKLHRPWTQLTQSQLASLAYTLTQTRPRCAGFMRQGGLTWLLRLLPRLKACQALMLLMIHLDPRLVFPSTSDLMAHVLPVLALRGFLPVTSSTQEKGALFGSTSSASIGTDDETSDPFFNGCVPSTQELRIQGYMALTNVVSCLNFNDAKGIKVKHWIKEVLHLDFFHPDPEVQVCVWECVGNFLGHPQVENGQDANDEHEEIRLFFSSLTSPPDPPTDPWPACLVHTLTSTSTSLRMKRASSTLLALTAPFLHHHDTWDRLETVLYTLHEPSLVHRWVHAFATSSNLACSGSQKKRVALWVVSKFGQENPFSDLVEALLSHST